MAEIWGDTHGSLPQIFMLYVADLCCRFALYNLANPRPVYLNQFQCGLRVKRWYFFLATRIYNSVSKKPYLYKLCHKFPLNINRTIPRGIQISAEFRGPQHQILHDKMVNDFPYAFFSKTLFSSLFIYPNSHLGRLSVHDFPYASCTQLYIQKRFVDRMMFRTGAMWVL